MKILIDVYPYRLNNGRPEFLLLKRSSGKIYASQWRMVGGKVEEGESRHLAALRELKEELGVTPELFWTLPSVNQFYEASTDSIHSIAAFGAELPEQSVIELDDEHTGFEWVQAGQIREYIKWPEQRRLINLIHEIITDVHSEILPQWIIPTD